MSNQAMGQVNMEKIASMSEDKQFVLATCIENILNGSNWGFMTKELKKVYPNASDLNSSNTLVAKVRVPVEGKTAEGTTFLVESDLKFSLKTIQEAAPTLVDKDFLNKYTEKRKSNEEAFKKFVENAVKGTGFKGYIGAYSINSTNTMTYKKERHKAFQIPLRTMLQVLANFPVKIAIDNQLVSPQQLVSADYSTVLSKLNVSEGSTALVLQLAIKGSK